MFKKRSWSLKLLTIFLLSVSLFLDGCVQKAQEGVTPTATTPAKGEWAPEKPIQIIVPYKAGGGTDVYARIVAKYWEKYLPGDQPIVIVNKPGGGGVITVDTTILQSIRIR